MLITIHLHVSQSGVYFLTKLLCSKTTDRINSIKEASELKKNNVLNGNKNVFAQRHHKLVQGILNDFVGSDFVHD